MRGRGARQPPATVLAAEVKFPLLGLESPTRVAARRRAPARARESTWTCQAGT